MLEDGRVVMHIHIREGMSTAVGAKEQRVARRIIAGIVGCCGSSYQSAIGVLGVSGRDALRNDGRLGVTPDVNHLCTGVSLLIVVGDGHRIELGLRIVTPQYAGGIFPSDSRAGLHLSPRQFGVNTAQVATLRHEVQDAAFTLLITGIPVLNRRVLHLCTIHDDNLDDGRMQLVLIAHRSRAAFEIRNVSIVVSDNQCALKLSRVPCIDAEIRTEFHRTANAFGDVDERTIAEYC